MKNTFEHTKNHIEFEDFCSVCRKKSKFQVDINDYKKEVVGHPYCLRCKTNAPELLKEHMEEFNEMMDQFHNVEDITKAVKKNYKIDENLPVIYSSETYPFLNFFIFLIIIPILFSLSIGLLTHTPKTDFVVMMMFLCGPCVCISVIGFVSAFVSMKKFKGYIEYMKKNGKKIDGKVTKIIQKTRTVTNRSHTENSHFYDTEFDVKEYYFEVEYYDDNNIQKTFVTKELTRSPIRDDIKCNVYKVNKLPSKYKNKNKYSKVFAYDFYW